jgi:2'-5' RNA ligase
MSIKLFIGTSISAELAETIRDHAQPLAERGRWRWSPLGQWHITSLFIGERSEADVPIIASAIENASLRTGPIVLRNGELTAMPEDHPNMLWVRFSTSEELSALHHLLAQDTATEPSPHRPYWPHITLARGTGALPEGADAILLPSLIIKELTLFRSDPGQKGTVHSALGTWPLRPTDHQDPLTGSSVAVV